MDRLQIATWMRERRVSLGMSQAALAGMVARTPQYISAIERMEPTANPTTDDLVRMLDALRADLTVQVREDETVPESKRLRIRRLCELASRASDDYIDGLIRFLDSPTPTR